MSAVPAGSSRLLVICGSHSATQWAADEALRELPCHWSHDLYEALANLVKNPRSFDALVLTPESLSRAVVASVPMVRRHLRIPVWILDKNAGPHRGHVEQALALGATRFPEANSTTAASGSAPASELSVPAADHPSTNGNGHHRHRPESDNEKIWVKPEEDLHDKRKSVATHPPTSYDSATQESLLSEAELKALLGDET